MASSQVDKRAALALLRHPDTTTVSLHEACALFDRHPASAYTAIKNGTWTEGIIHNGRFIRVSAAWLRQQLHVEVVEPPTVESSEPEPNDPPLRELAPEHVPRAVMKPSRKRAVPAGAR